MTVSLIRLHALYTTLGHVVVAGCAFALIGCADLQSEEAEADAPAWRYQEEQFAAERGITKDEARLRLSWQVSAGKLQGQLVERIPADSFGGVWIDPDDGDRIKVGIVSERSDADGERARRTIGLQVDTLAEDVGIADVVDVVPVEQSLKELESLALRLVAETTSISPEAKEVMARPERNSVSISVSPETSAADVARVKAIAQQLGISKIEIHADAKPSYRHATTCSYSGGWRNCSPSRAGQALYRLTGTSTYTATCTMAFAVSRGSTLKARLTAAHCFPVPDNANWYTRTPGGSYTLLGWPSYSYLSDSMDARLIGLQNPSSTNYHRYLAGNSNYDKNILGSAACVPQANVCFAGARSGEQCGIVQGCNASAYLDGKQAYGLFRVRVGSQGGDSGAPMYLGQYAYGILVGGNSSDTYGYNITSVLNALGATLYTGV